MYALIAYSDLPISHSNTAIMTIRFTFMAIDATGRFAKYIFQQFHKQRVRFSQIFLYIR